MFKFQLVKGTTTRFVADVGYKEYPFPIYERGVNIGKSYIGIRPSLFSSYQLKRFEYCIELKNGKILTGFNVLEDYKTYSFGNDRSLGLDNLVIINTDLDSFVNLEIIPRNHKLTELEQFQEYIKGVENECYL